jgi:hypothetical protein
VVVSRSRCSSVVPIAPCNWCAIAATTPAPLLACAFAATTAGTAAQAVALPAANGSSAATAAWVAAPIRATSPAIRASSACTVGNFANGRPNCSRSFTYVTVMSSARWVAPAMSSDRNRRSRRRAISAVPAGASRTSTSAPSRTSSRGSPARFRPGLTRSVGAMTASQSPSPPALPDPPTPLDPTATVVASRPYGTRRSKTPEPGPARRPKATATVSGPAGMARPARASSIPAASVSASGTGAAAAPAAAAMAAAAERSPPLPPAVSGDPARVRPVFARACHRPASHPDPAAAAATRAGVQCAASRSSTVCRSRSRSPSDAF